MGHPVMKIWVRGINGTPCNGWVVDSGQAKERGYFVLSLRNSMPQDEPVLNYCGRTRSMHGKRGGEMGQLSGYSPEYPNGKSRVRSASESHFWGAVLALASLSKQDRGHPSGSRWHFGVTPGGIQRPSVFRDPWNSRYWRVHYIYIYQKKSGLPGGNPKTGSRRGGA